MEETKKLGFESAADGVGLFDKENPKNLPTEEELTVAMETAHRESRKVKKNLRLLTTTCPLCFYGPNVSKKIGETSSAHCFV